MRTEGENWGEGGRASKVCASIVTFSTSFWLIEGVGINFAQMPLDIIGSPGNRCLVPLQYRTTPCALPRSPDPAIATQGKPSMVP